jgi:WD40 repeat protein
LARWNKFVLIHEFDGQSVVQNLKLEHAGDIMDMRFSPDGQRLIVGNGTEKVYVWDWPSKKLIAVVKGCCRANWGMAHTQLSWSPDS